MEKMNLAEIGKRNTTFQNEAVLVNDVRV